MQELCIPGQANKAKAEVCLFHRNDVKQIELDLCGVVVKPSLTMNVLSVLFYSKM